MGRDFLLGRRLQPRRRLRDDTRDGLIDQPSPLDDVGAPVDALFGVRAGEHAQQRVCHLAGSRFAIEHLHEADRHVVGAAALECEIDQQPGCALQVGLAQALRDLGRGYVLVEAVG